MKEEEVKKEETETKPKNWNRLALQKRVYPVANSSLICPESASSTPLWEIRAQGKLYGDCDR